jgi:hypothetical protein
MTYNDKKGIFSINKYYKLNDYTEDQIKGFIFDIANGINYCKNIFNYLNLNKKCIIKE